ncbi:MAG TPA: 4Fe-4S dicluster domain-containing protein [Longimicrobiales bacterium]|nr:4Fe-4S dicluster domain-containing protein [Longimicrobiales bacterium]
MSEQRDVAAHAPRAGAAPLASIVDWERVGARQEAELTAGVRIEAGKRYGFFTDTTLCIGCKACEVACKQWNQLPAEEVDLVPLTYDNTRSFSATTWRHVRFVEQLDEQPDLQAIAKPWGWHGSEQWADPGSRWLMMSDVCKHCATAPCMEACPTGSIIRTEFDSVYVQQDICNGCGYCQVACPFGVIEVATETDGKAHKCTLCYDRLRDGLEPACAKSCPTDSIRFGVVDQLLEEARVRVADLRARGVTAYLYGSGGPLEDDCDTSALGGLNCFFLLIDRPEVYNLPAVPQRPSERTLRGLVAGMITALAIGVGVGFTLRRDAR